MAEMVTASVRWSGPRLSRRTTS